MMVVMALNIKNPKTVELAREYAARTGQSQTSAVEDALRMALEHLDKETEVARWAATVDMRILATEQILADLEPAPPGERERIDNLIYDENGLFR